MILSYINNILGTVDAENIKETFSVYEIEFYHKDIKVLAQNLNEKNYNLLNNALTEINYKWDLVIDDFSFSIKQNDCFNSLTIEDTDDTDDVLVRFNIYKSRKTINVISNSIFNQYLKGLTLENLLSIIKTFDDEFILINEIDDFEIGINKNLSSTELLSKQCHFRNQESFPFTPETFYFDNIDKKTKSLLDDYISKLSFIYCLIYLFDYSEISENNLNLTISGNTTLKYSIDFNKIDIQNLKHFYRIYKWVYSEENKVEDKIVLARNILTSYMSKDSIDIDNSTFNSILSSYQVYIKGNISKYFEVKNKIINQVEQTINGVNKSIDLFVGNFQKSTFIFISFFLSIFIFKIINKKNIDNIFTKETSLLGLGFITISFVFLIASIIIYRLDKKRLKERYGNVKNRFKDVLIKDDIDKILNKDSEYNNEIEHLENRIFVYGTVWLLSIIIFTIALFLTSDYLNL